jgi:AcrR family transcriptional regulator
MPVRPRGPAGLPWHSRHGESPGGGPDGTETRVVTTPGPPLSGRRAEARRNDATILASARDVFVADPDAPIAAVAHHAGVNISSLYRRFTSKEDLLRRLCSDGLRTYLEVARAAVADETGDPWEVFATFMERIMKADTHALTVKLAGRFTPNEQNLRDATEAFSLDERLVARTQAAGVLRDDISAHDLSLVFEQLTSLKGATPERTAELKARYLALHLDALRAPGHTALPGPPPTAEELSGRWQPRPT